MELTYTEKNGYLYPDLALPEEPEVELGRYALMRRSYLEKHRRGMFAALLMNGGLNPHLLETEKAAMERLESQTKAMAKAEGVTEKLKSDDTMAWIRAMTNIRSRVEETILSELIYS